MDNKYKIMKYRPGILLWVFFIGAVGLRFLLYWANLPSNAFDNHFDPIFWIMKYGTLPSKDAFWQSYQPPVFYVISAMIGKLAINLGTEIRLLPKILQFMSCLYGILTIGFVYLILKKIPLSDFSRMLAFGSVCFLPRHIYLSAMHSNDTIAALSVALCVYLMMIALERKLSYPTIITLSISITITLFTKYTSFVVLPMALTILVPFLLQRIIIPRKKLINAFLLLIIVPILFLSAYCYSNIKKYDLPLPWNSHIVAPAETQARTETGLSFLTFTPWKTIRTPILAPWNMDSFWTLIYSRMMFDMEPKFLPFIDQEVTLPWWINYYQWLRGERGFPSSIQLSSFTYFTGSALIAIGLVPLLLIIIGAYVSVFGDFGALSKVSVEGAIRSQIFIVLFLFNALGIMALAIKSSVFSSVKATYFIGSIPALSVFLGLGVMSCEKNRIIKWILALIFGVFFILVALHIIHIAYSLDFSLGI